MKTGIVYKDKSWVGHPDVVLFRNRLYVTFRQSFSHRSDKNTSIYITSTLYNKSDFSTPQMITKSKKHRYNCPRLSVINSCMYLICDLIENQEDKDGFVKAENNEKNTRSIIFFTRDGIRWTRLGTSITGIVPDRIKFRNGNFITATHTLNPKTGNLCQNIWKTKNIQKEWTKISTIEKRGLNLCEGSIVDNDGFFACLLRENSSLGHPALICYSNNSGETWSSVCPTRMFGCHRPVGGQLKSGNYLVTYREASHSFHNPYWAKNTFACLIDKESFENKKNPCKDAIILPLDHDNSSHSDSGYTGWVQLPNDDIFIVNYVTKKSKKPYIVWYKIQEEMF